MRIKILLEPLNKINHIPINYQYHLSSVVYNIMANGSEEYAKWLHEVGYTDADGKKLKFFAFSNLYFEKYKIQSNFIRFEGGAYFYLSNYIRIEIALSIKSLNPSTFF